MPAETPHLPTVKQLRYFVALVEEEHFGRAAARCFVSQSAFSVAIRDLESLLQGTLVDRTNRKVTVTAKGREIAVLAKLCIQDLKTLVEAARGGAQPLTGALQLGIIPTIAPFLLPRVLPKVRSSFPGLELYLYEDITQRLLERLMEGSIDVVLMAFPYAAAGVERMELFKDRFRLAARAGTALVEPEHYRFNRLNAGNVLLLREGHCLREHAIDACRIKDAQKLSPFSATSLLTLIEMVDADLGISFLPEMAVGSALLKNTRVKTYPLAAASYRTIGLAWRRGSARADEFRMLGDFIRRAFNGARRRRG